MADAECEDECEPYLEAECEVEYEASKSILVTSAEPRNKIGRLTDVLAHGLAGFLESLHRRIGVPSTHVLDVGLYFVRIAAAARLKISRRCLSAVEGSAPRQLQFDRCNILNRLDQTCWWCSGDQTRRDCEKSK